MLRPGLFTGKFRMPCRLLRNRRMVLRGVGLSFFVYVLLLFILRRTVGSSLLCVVQGAFFFPVAMTGSHNTHEVYTGNKEGNQQHAKPEGSAYIGVVGIGLRVHLFVTGIQMRFVWRGRNRRHEKEEISWEMDYLQQRRKTNAAGGKFPSF